MPLYQHYNKQKVSPPPATVLLGNYSAVSTTNVNYSLTQEGSGIRLANTGNVNTNISYPDYNQNICLVNTSVGYSTGQVVTAKMKFNSYAIGDQIGFGLRQSSNGIRIVSLACPAGLVNGFRRCRFLSNNSFSSHFGDAAFSHSVGASFWMSVQDDGTNYIFGYSSDGTNFTTTVRAKSSYSITSDAPNQICLLMVPYYNTTSGNRTDLTYETISVA